MVNVIFCGLIEDNSQEDVLRAKVSSLLKKRPNFFDLLIILNSNIEFRHSFSIETWCFNSKYFGHSNETDIKWLNGAGVNVFKDISIAFFDNLKIENDAMTQSFIESCNYQSRVVDVLLVRSWPQCLKTTEETKNFSDTIFSNINVQYGFICNNKENVYYERAPYSTKSKDGQRTHFTRLISLAGVTAAPKTEKNKKWLHALSIKPIQNFPLTTFPVDCTDSPFQTVTKKTKGLHRSVIAKLIKESSEKQNEVKYFDDTISREDQCSKRRRLNKRNKCWFCLSSPTCDRNLVVSVGNEVFLSIPKGMINGHHIQIIPVKHCFSIYELDGLEDRLYEIELYKSSLVNFLESVNNCAAIIFERKINLDKARQQHAFIEIIPFPKTSKSVLQLFQEEAAAHDLNFVNLKQATSSKNLPGHLLLQKYLEKAAIELNHEDMTLIDYVFIEVPGILEPHVCLINVDLVKKSFIGRDNVPLQMGRSIACKILDCVRKIDWRSCLLSEEEENDVVCRYKKEFAEFEPKLGDENK